MEEETVSRVKIVNVIGLWVSRKHALDVSAL